MKEVDLLQKRISLEALLLAVVSSGTALMLREMSVAVGLLVGTLASILNFKLLAMRLRRSTSPARPRISFNLFTSLIVRYAIMGLILWAAINKGLGWFFGAAAGLLTIKIAIYIDTFLVPERWKA